MLDKDAEQWIEAFRGWAAGDGNMYARMNAAEGGTIPGWFEVTTNWMDKNNINLENFDEEALPKIKELLKQPTIV